MHSWTKKGLVVVAAGAVLTVGVGAAFAGENSSEPIQLTDIQLTDQVNWTLDPQASAPAAARAYQQMITEVRQLSASDDYFVLNAALTGPVAGVDAANGTNVQIVLRGRDAAPAGFINPTTNQFFPLDPNAPNFRPPRDDRRRNQPPPPQRRDPRVRVAAQTLAASTSGTANQVKVSFDSIISSIASLIQTSTGIPVADLITAVSSIVQTITDATGSSDTETAITGALQDDTSATTTLKTLAVTAS